MQTTSLLKPYPDTGNLSVKKKIYNATLSSTRMIVENANGRLKNKWRRLKLIHTETVNRAKDIIKACLVLHNFTLLKDSNLSSTTNDNEFNPPLVFTSGNMKRDYIANYLML